MGPWKTGETPRVRTYPGAPKFRSLLSQLKIMSKIYIWREAGRGANNNYRVDRLAMIPGILPSVILSGYQLCF
jgi:hypothetical protein